MKRRRILEIVLIKWIDSETGDGWQESPDSLKLEENISVGYLIRQDLDIFLLAADYDPECDQFNRLMWIPRGCVTKLRVLTYIPIRTKASVSSVSASDPHSGSDSSQSNTSEGSP